MSIRDIALEYLEGRQMRTEAEALSNKRLSTKFERSQRTIAKVANRQPCKVPEEEQRLILQCIAERDRLKSGASIRTLEALARRYRVAKDSILNELVAMGALEDVA